MIPLTSAQDIRSRGRPILSVARSFMAHLDLAHRLVLAAIIVTIFSACSADFSGDSSTKISTSNTPTPLPTANQLTAQTSLPSIRVRYPASDSNPYYYQRVKYFVEILDLALSKSGRSYTLEKIDLPFMKEGRSSRYILNNTYDVHWINTQNELEQDLQPIRIPLFKGLIGWRIFFINADSQADFSAIDSIAKLRQKVAVLGHDWPDTPLFEQQRLPVKTSVSWEGMFGMLNARRIDYFPRSALEIWDERNAFPDFSISIEKDLVLHYPAAYYFFVDRKNTQLAEMLETGLNRAVADGSFDLIFNKYFAERLEQLKLKERRRIDLEVDSLPPGAPLERTELWYQP